MAVLMAPVKCIFTFCVQFSSGSEGRLAFPYQRVGMVNAIQELSYADGKYLISLARTICNFLLSYYKDDGMSQALILLTNKRATYLKYNLESLLAKEVGC